MYFIILSACIYLISFIYPNYLYCGLFLYLVPLFISDVQYKFKEGYLWGFIFFAGHLSWFGQMIYEKGQGDMRMIVYLVTVCYFAIFSGFWFS